MSAKRLPWIERKFFFPYPVERHPEVVARFRGTPARAEDVVRGLSEAAVKRKVDEGWTIQENIGHLLDLEALFDGRIDDFLAGKDVLRAADMTNQATKQAGHNRRKIEGLLAELRAAREAQARRLEAMKPADFSRESLHPRLKQKMRLVDAVEFVCEHDDYHLSRCWSLRRVIEGAG
jgi:DinB superfamily